jgi:hypothetical protein
LSRKQESVTDGCYYYIPSLLSREDKNIDIQIYNYSNTILPLVLCFPLGNFIPSECETKHSNLTLVNERKK